MKESLARLEVACRFLAKVFHLPPEAAFLRTLAEEGLMTEWPLDTAVEDAQTGLRLMEVFFAGWTESQLPELEADFNRLFVGPGRPLAPPWESYYLDADHLLFQEQTLAVRRAYREFGLEVPQTGGEPDDSLGLELTFVAELCRMALEDGAPDEDLPAIRQFLSSHLLRWAPQCLRLVIAGARLDYYRAAAFLALGCLLDAQRLTGLPGD